MRPVSNTIRLQSGAFANPEAIAVGEVVVFVSSTTLPSRSTTQICVSSIDTSNPAKYSMAALLLASVSRHYRPLRRAAAPLPHVEKVLNDQMRIFLAF